MIVESPSLTANANLASMLERSASLGGLPWLRHGITRKVAGLGKADGNVGYTAPRDEQDAWEMRQVWARAVGVEPESLIRVRQVHCAEVHVATEADLARGAHPSAAGAPVADAIVTNTPGLALMTLHADCLALLLADPYTRSIAAVHAGWRSTVVDIVTATIQSMRREFGTRARDLIAFIGPSIGVDRYQVGSEVVDGWSSLHARTDAIRETDDGFRFDLKQANLERLVANGVPRDQIEVSEVCTASNPDDWFSHRGQGALTGRFAAIISIVDDGVLS